MGDWPVVTASRWANINSPYGTSITSSGSTNTKGSWVQLVAATPYDASGLVVVLVPTGTSGTENYLVDIGIGLAGNEQVIAPNLLVAGVCSSNIGEVRPFTLPIWIPSGVRLSARCQCSTGTRTVLVKAMLLGSVFDDNILHRIEAWGAATGDSGGTQIDPGAVINTKGSWVQLIASTSFHTEMLLFTLGNARNTNPAGVRFAIDIGIGAAGNEQVIVPDLLCCSDFNGYWMPPVFGPLPLVIPNGSRIVVRAQAGTTDGTDRLFDSVLYGIG